MNSRMEFLFPQTPARDFLGTHSNICFWPVVQHGADMSLVPNGYKQTSGKKNHMIVDKITFMDILPT